MNVTSSRWRDNPRLNQWLSTQEAAFPAWRQATSGTWDFTPESLDRLEDILLSRYADHEEADAAHESPFMTVAVWYLGETVRRAHPNAVWSCSPTPGEGSYARMSPLLTYATETLDEQVREEVEEREATYDEVLPFHDPTDDITALHISDGHLREILDDYAAFQEFLDSLA
ncbi:hypothetical protein [Streptomyces cavernicola]|uniref:DUF4375 domain-containing protein n=1 Tax=Streptomyces cavernicola TaxID=3043613 RepID=A0ABT6SFM0_9ACTN|nr:hypothetical protein [Streptomyces sp. B-S-A6]MDI3406960.1 hypothetical protein [Streptomyces sp. B-S-A6]